MILILKLISILENFKKRNNDNKHKKIDVFSNYKICIKKKI